MAYRQSPARRRWTSERLARIGVLATAHASVGGVSGPGRPLSASKPLAHAYVIGMLGEFQGFARDLHDLAVEAIVIGSGAGPTYSAVLTEGMTRGRSIDRGNASTAAVKSDFARIGLTPFELASYNSRWHSHDSGAFDRLVQLRNVLGHGNDAELRRLLATGTVKDTVSWARNRLPLLHRHVRALDLLVWAHLTDTTGKDPWT